jgi:hypothetical protein
LIDLSPTTGVWPALGTICIFVSMQQQSKIRHGMILGNIACHPLPASEPRLHAQRLRQQHPSATLACTCILFLHSQFISKRCRSALFADTSSIVCRYMLFLELQRKLPQEPLCLTADIEVLWHAHLSQPHQYKMATETLVGCHLGHDAAAPSCGAAASPVEQAASDVRFASHGSRRECSGGMSRGVPKSLSHAQCVAAMPGVFCPPVGPVNAFLQSVWCTASASKRALLFSAPSVPVQAPFLLAGT